MKYELLDGKTLDLGAMPRKDLAFLLELQRRVLDGQDYFDLARAVCGTGAYPLKGSLRVTREVHGTELFQVAMDIVDRAGIRQGRIAPDPGDRLAPTEGIVSVSQAAKKLGVTRAAVIKAAQHGRIQGKKIGQSWALVERSVQNYQVARHRVKAGRAAHRVATRSKASAKATRR